MYVDCTHWKAMEINLLNYFCRSKILSPNQIREIKSLDSNIETCQDMSKY